MKALYEDVRAIGTPKWVSESGTARVTPRELPFSIGSACSACWEHLPRSSENVCYFLLQIKRLWIGRYDFVSLGMKYSVAVMSHVSLCHAWFRGLWRYCFWVLVTTLSYTYFFSADWLWIYCTLALVQSYWLRSYYWNIAWEKPNLWKNHEI